MYIKHLDGKFAGQVRDMKNETALSLLESGRAVKAFQEPVRSTPQIESAPPLPRPAGAEKTSQSRPKAGKRG